MLAAALALLLAAPDSPCVEIAAVSDLHGHAGALPAIAARVNELRRRGPALALDAGDGLQGTLEADLSRGAAVVAGYGALGLDAAAAGNHDFDYGQEVLRRRLAEASYPFLAANLRVRATGERPAWRNLLPRRLFRPPGGPAVGVFGLSGEDTPRATMPGNVAGLEFLGTAGEAARQAAALRAEGAELVVALAHLGGRCARPGAPDDLSGCDEDSDLFRLARGIAPGAVDAVVAGHTHALLARRVNGVAVIEAGARGEYLGRLTLCAGGAARFHPFERLDAPGGPPPDARVAAAVAPYLAAARAERERPLGVALGAPLRRGRRAFSPFGAAAAQSLRAELGADFGLVNAGALRVDLPAGPLAYGQLYEALPFDDGLALLRIRGREVEALLRALAGDGKALPQAAGLQVGPDGARTCAGERLTPDALYTVATTGFLAEGGDGAGGVVARLPAGSVVRREAIPLREAFLRWLRRPADRRIPQACP